MAAYDREQHGGPESPGDAKRFFDDGDICYMPEPAGLLRCNLHPDLEAISTRHERWLRDDLHLDHARLATILAERHDTLIGLTLPGATTDRAEVILQLTTLLFLLDDVTSSTDDDAGDGTERVRGVFDVLIGTLAAGDHHPAAGMGSFAMLERLLARLRTDMSTPQWERFVPAMVTFADASVREVAMRADRIGMSFEDFVAFRVLAAAVEPYLYLVQYAIGVDLEEVRTPDLAAFEAAAGVHMALANDLHSFRAEHYNDDHVNAVAIGCVEHALTLQESIDRVSDRIADAERRLIELREAILGATSVQLGEVGRYLGALGDVVAGNQRWSYMTGRYHGIAHEWNGRTHGNVRLLPDRTILCVEGSGRAGARGA